jgi:hypothetical protein
VNGFCCEDLSKFYIVWTSHFLKILLLFYCWINFGKKTLKKFSHFTVSSILKNWCRGFNLDKPK